MNDLVLRPVIHEHPAQVGDEGDAHDIQEEDGDTDEPFHQVEHERVGEGIFEHLDDRQRDDYEQTDGHDQSDPDRDGQLLPAEGFLLGLAGERRRLFRDSRRIGGKALSG